MTIQDLDQLSSEDLATALDDLQIGRGWVVGDSLRRGRQLEELEASRRRSPSAGFRNQIVGKIAERVFERRHLDPLARAGYEVRDLHETGENRDYVVSANGEELPINVKTASTLFRTCGRYGLDPEDCIPISAYKAIGASERVPDLVYVDMVDFSLRERVDAHVAAFRGSSRAVWMLLSWYGGAGARRAQNEYVSQLFAGDEPALLSLAPGASGFRVISAQRVLQVMRENPRRCPGLGVPAAGTGVFNAEVNIHVSVRNETWAWADVEQIMRSEGVAAVLALVRHEEIRSVRSPGL